MSSQSHRRSFSFPTRRSLQAQIKRMSCKMDPKVRPDDDDCDAVNDSQPKPKRCSLVSFKDLPDYMKDNEFILHYYRANWPLREALFSVFRWHNETLNVWTHLLGFALFVGLTVANLLHVQRIADLFHIISRDNLNIIYGSFTKSTTNYGTSYVIRLSLPMSAELANISNNSKQLFVATGEAGLINFNRIATANITAPPLDPLTRWPFYVFLVGSMFCLLSSTICHLFSCHSKHLNLLLLRIDYAGITTMIIASFFPPIFYIFQCDHHWQFIYLGGITAMGAFTIVTLLSPALSSGKFRFFRAMLFASMGFFGLVPAVHAMVVHWENPRRNVTLAYEAAMAVFYLTGTGLYVARVPERWRPGWFDLAGHSHQIFHVFVVLGALAHYGATLVFLEWREGNGC